eukprot:11034915-Alexandrium_andersonii.AAC.1
MQELLLLSTDAHSQRTHARAPPACCGRTERRPPGASFLTAFGKTTTTGRGRERPRVVNWWSGGWLKRW